MTAAAASQQTKNRQNNHYSITKRGGTPALCFVYHAVAAAKGEIYLAELVVHPLPPLIDAQCRVLVLGTMPSPASRRGQFYYAHPRNRFWLVLAQVLGEEDPGTPAGRRALALRHHVALWDVLASCEIDGAADGSIRSPQPNDLAPQFAQAPLQAVFTTGKKAEQLYKKYLAEKTGFTATCLPSPSPANCAVPLPALIEAYRAMLPWLGE